MIAIAVHYSDCLLKIATLLVFIHLVDASLGDRLIIFQNELQSCLENNCSSREALSAFEAKQPFYLWLFGWDCASECKFHSQWSTLDALKSGHVDTIPQFYGKWPFYRLFGIQEPASFFFSILNFFSNLYSWLEYRRKTEKCDPFYRVWKIQTLIALNAWFWSTIYHGRDTPLSEKLDYFSAYSMVLFSVCAILLKKLSERKCSQNIIISSTVPFVAFYFYHIHYLYFVHFDYGYNMTVNILTGVLSTVCWITWCFANRKEKKHVWKCTFSLICINLGLALELLDFPPISFIFDAHSLWHLATFPLPFLWYNFLTDEALYLANHLDISSKKFV